MSPKHIYEAMQTGPQSMPSFPDSTMPEQEKKDIIAYIKTVNGDESEDPGGSRARWPRPRQRGSVRLDLRPGRLIAVAVWVAAHTAKAKKS